MKSYNYLLATVDGAGTVPPELGVVRRLLGRGHRVTVLADDSMEAEVRATGAAFLRWEQAPNQRNRDPSNVVTRDWECKNPFQLVDQLIATRFVGPAASIAADVDAAIARTRPDLVLSSMFCLGAMIAAESAGIPFDVLMPNAYLLPAEGMPPFGLGLKPARGPLGRLRDRALHALTQRLWDRKGLAPLNALRAARGLPALRSLWDQVHRARRELILTTLAFDFPARLPAGARYVGPILDDPTWASGERWTPPPGAAPLVLVSMSTSFQDQRGSLQRVVAALATLPIRAVVTTGLAIDASTLWPATGDDSARARIQIVAAAPHAGILPHAAAVITHGGHGTIIKALAAGLPLVILPHGRDQGDNAARISARGAGIALNRNASPAAIGGAVQRVLHEPSYRRAAARLRDAVRSGAGCSDLLSELEDLPAARSLERESA